MAQNAWQRKTCAILTRIDPEDYARFRQYCQNKDIPMATWIKERIQEAIAHEPYPEIAEHVIVAERRAQYGEVRKRTKKARWKRAPKG